MILGQIIKEAVSAFTPDKPRKEWGVPEDKSQKLYWENLDKEMLRRREKAHEVGAQTAESIGKMVDDWSKAENGFAEIK